MGGGILHPFCQPRQPFTAPDCVQRRSTTTPVWSGALVPSDTVSQTDDTRVGVTGGIQGGSGGPGCGGQGQMTSMPLLKTGVEEGGCSRSVSVCVCVSQAIKNNPQSPQTPPAHTHTHTKHTAAHPAGVSQQLWAVSQRPSSNCCPSSSKSRARTHVQPMITSTTTQLCEVNEISRVHRRGISNFCRNQLASADPAAAADIQHPGLSSH